MTVATTENTGLAIDAEQQGFNDRQVAALTHMGVEHATPGDLEVFFHVCQRSGLDPFARQIYMIGRQTSEKRGDQWVKVTKQTIQTGIDGFRLIGRRAANRAGHKVSVEAPEWAHEDGSWRPVWQAGWGVPIAARVTIHRDGEPFTAVALFDEYKQTKRDGGLTQMWSQRPAGQIAKCAEALAWRMAFPQDLSGIYSDDEMQQADSRPADSRPAGGLSGVLAANDPDPAEVEDVTDAEVVEDAPQSDDELLDVRSGLAVAMFAAIHEAGITEAERLPWVSSVIDREVTSSKEMTAGEARKVLATLDGAK